MITSTTEETGTAPATTAGETPKPNKKARVAPSRAPVAPAKAKSGKKASPAKKAPKGRTKAKVAKPEARGGSKGAKILDLLKRRLDALPFQNLGDRAGRNLVAQIEHLSGFMPPLFLCARRSGRRGRGPQRQSSEQ